MASLGLVNLHMCRRCIPAKIFYARLFWFENVLFFPTFNVRSQRAQPGALTIASKDPAKQDFWSFYFILNRADELIISDFRRLEPVFRVE